MKPVAPVIRTFILSKYAKREMQRRNEKQEEYDLNADGSLTPPKRHPGGGGCMKMYSKGSNAICIFVRALSSIIYSFFSNGESLCGKF
jgi:hypothetical protein